MQCPNCGSDQAREISTTRASKDLKGNLIILDNVPMITCKNCGEAFFTAKAVQMMDQIREHPEMAEKKEVHFYHFESG